MRTRDVVELVAVLLQKHELINTGIFTANEMDAEIQEEINTNKELQLLIRCANLVAKEIACDYLPLLFTQRISCAEGTVPYAAFEKALLEIKTWKNLKGENVSYFTFPDHIDTLSGEYEVTYTFVPDTKEFLDELDFSGTKISDRIIAYGAAAEFCLISGLYDDALIWERRYKDALNTAIKKTNTVFLPRRPWW